MDPHNYELEYARNWLKKARKELRTGIIDDSILTDEQNKILSELTKNINELKAQKQFQIEELEIAINNENELLERAEHYKKIMELELKEFVQE